MEDPEDAEETRFVSFLHCLDCVTKFGRPAEVAA